NGRDVLVRLPALTSGERAPHGLPGGVRVDAGQLGTRAERLSPPSGVAASVPEGPDGTFGQVVHRDPALAERGCLPGSEGDRGDWQVRVLVGDLADGVSQRGWVVRTGGHDDDQQGVCLATASSGGQVLRQLL